jgi:hypothetical protein
MPPSRRVADRLSVVSAVDPRLAGIRHERGTMSDENEIEIEINIPEGASPEEEQRLIDEAIDKKIDDDLDKMLRDSGF